MKPRLNRILTMVAGLLSAICPLHATAADGLSRNAIVVVRADGSVVTQAEITPGPDRRKRQQVRLDFGLPRKAPESRWLEDERLPICHTQWGKNGIRYTQTVFVTRLGHGELPDSGEPVGDAVLMVQVFGENLTNEYAEAAAELAVEIEGAAMPLELQNGLVYSTQTNASVLLAAIDIPSSGITSPKGPRLQFQGSMPPGNTGTMTVKVPFAPIKGEDQINRLLDLEFSEEFRRVKQSWKGRGNGQSAPVTFAK